MKETILIVEDDPTDATLLRTKIEAVQDGDTEMLHAETRDEAVEFAASGRISYCALDLELPQSKREKTKVGVAGKCRLGFEVLGKVLANNPHVEVRVLSRHTDISTISEDLVKEFRQDRRIIDLNSKKDDTNYADKVASDVMGLTDINPVLQRRGIQVVHFLERRLARKLWKLAGRTWCWPTPIVVLRGESRMGKDRWAHAVPEFRDAQHPCANRVACTLLDLGQVSRSGSGDSALIKLFGARNYQGVAEAAGIFERATGRKNNHQVDFNRSNYAVLSELGNLPGECQSLVLEVIDSNPDRGGRITRQGTGNIPMGIGCGFIFTTNARLEKQVVPSDEAGEGTFREDLYERLGAGHGWLFVPSFREMGVEAFIAHLRLAIERHKQKDYEIGPTTDRVLRSSFEDPGQRFSHESILRIVRAFLADGGNRLTPDHVSAALHRPPQESQKPTPSKHPIETELAPAPALLKKSDELPGPEPLGHETTSQSIFEVGAADQRHWGIEQIVQTSILEEGTNEYHVLKLLLRNSDAPLSRKLLLGNVNSSLNAEEKVAITDGQLTTALKAVKRKVSLHPEWQIAFLKTASGYKVSALLSLDTRD